MTSIDIQAILPLLVLGITTAVVVIQMSIKRSHILAMGLTLTGLVIAFWSLTVSWRFIPHHVSSLLIVDGYSLIFSGIILITSFFVTIMMYSYLSHREEHREEMYALLLLAVIGSIVLTMADHFVSLILGLETLTISLYVMIGYLRNDLSSLEAGVKYLILAAASSAFLVFGMGLIYASAGSMSFSVLVVSLHSGPDDLGFYVTAGTILIIVGTGFKLGVVPFHMWTPDVYQGAPAPVTGFIATVSKTATIALLFRFLSDLGFSGGGVVMYILGLVAIASMLFGNLLALMQSNIKRILAYSSIAHLGYVLVAVVIGGSDATEAIVFYLLAYSFTTIGAFGLISYISGEKAETTALDDYRGLFWKRPAAAAVLSVMMLSLAGIPLTAGFIGKYLLLLTGVSVEQWTLVIVLVVTSVVGLYYYLRVIATMLATDEKSSEQSSVRPLTSIATTILAIVTLIVIYLGVAPSAMLSMIHRMLAQFFTA